MLMDLQNDHDHYEHLAGIEEYVQSASQLTKQLLGFARGGKYQVRPTNLNKLVAESASLFGRTKKEILIHSKLQEDLWTVESDQAQIKQVLLNLYVNAWQAMPSGGTLYLQTANVSLDDNVAGASGVKAGRYVRISVTDTGVGMSEATQRRIFDPFFTTKDRGRGTGLGLASAYGIVSNHGGFFDVSSEQGKGSLFQIYLPAAEREIAPEKQVRAEPLLGKGTVLLVDDERMILDVGQRMLQALGYDVLIARNGEEAIDTYKRQRESIQLVVLDLVMPGMGGGEVYDQLRELDPDSKILLASGYSIDGQAKEILARGCNGFIQKPFDLGDLSHALRNTVGR
jgi:CheY-like chemotaxis protein